MIAAAAAIALVMVGCTDDRGPRLESVAPAAAQRNATVEIVGRRLCGETANCETAGGEVQIGLSLPTVKANIVDYSDTRALITIPQVAPVGTTELVIVVNERSSNAIDFEVLP